jgi:hypothetical protein
MEGVFQYMVIECDRESTSYYLSQKGIFDLSFYFAKKGYKTCRVRSTLGNQTKGMKK